MGVKIADLMKPAIKEITLANLLRKKIAIDAFNSIFQFLATIRQQDGTPLTDFNGNVTSHLSGLFYRTLNLIEHDIKPLYVFDGPPHDLKLQTIRERRRIREEQKKKMEDALDDENQEDAKKFAQGTSKLTSEMIEESKLLLTYLGVPYVEAAHDGEAEAARLVKEGIVWATSSQDYDSLLFGAERLIRNLNINRKKKVRNVVVSVPIEYINLKTALSSLELTQKQLVDIGILVGLDFFPGIKGIGEKTAVKLIQTHGSLEGIIKSDALKKYNTEHLTGEIIAKVRSIFLDIQPPTTPVSIKWKHVNEEKITELLCEQHNFGMERVDNALRKLRQKRSQKVQTSLDEFF